jgi:Fur family ferric uptake transcriptional regulator
VATLQQALDQFRSFLHGRLLRVTNLREGIVKAALAKKGHFDIDDLVVDLRAQGVDASKATVYRALPLLLEAGIIQPTISPGERQRYEAAVGQEHHDHLVCTRCGRVVEFQFEAFEVLQREVASKYGFRLTGHSHQLLGVCPSCQG